MPYYTNGGSRIRKDRQIKISLQEETLTPAWKINYREEGRMMEKSVKS